MAVIDSTLFFRNNRTYKVGIITFDLILAESHSFSNDVTQYNVEDGSIISDHIRNQLESGTVSGLITNFSLYDGALFGNKSQEAFDQLVYLWRQRSLVDIFTVLKIYNQVAITNIAISRDNNSGEELVADFSFQEFNIVKLQEIVPEVAINLASMSTDQNRQSAPNINTGKQTGVQTRSSDFY